MTSIKNTTKYEDLSPENIIDNYIRLKELERQRNRKSYQKLKENQNKYHNRLNENLIYQLERVENIKSDDQKLQEYKERRKIVNKKSYDKRKALQQQEI